MTIRAFLLLSPEGNRLYRDGQDTLVLLFPLYHIAGLATCLVAGFYVGATFVTYPKFDFANYLGAMQKYKVSVYQSMFDKCRHQVI